MAAISAAAASITRAVGAGAVPGHADEEGTVVPEIRRPPVLRIGHDGGDIFFQQGEIEALKFLCVIEVRIHRVRLRCVLVKDAKIELVWPPVAVGGAAACGFCEELAMVEGALGFGGHKFM